MQLAARSYVAAAAALAAGGMIAVTPAKTEPVFHPGAVQLAGTGSDIALADPLQTLQLDELSFNAALVTQELGVNGDLVAAEESLASSIASAFPSATVIGGGGLSGAVDRLFDANNLLVVGTSENLYDSLFGGDNFDPVAINSSLIISAGNATTGPGLYASPDVGAAVGNPVVGAPFLSGQIGGVEGATGNSLAAYNEFIAFVNTQYGLTLADFPATNVPVLGEAIIAFNNALIADELAFNVNLLDEEVAAEVATFGSNNALNGIIDRLINVDNLELSTAENTLNSLIGATDPTISPADLTQSLLTGVGSSPTDIPNVFDTGDLGGLEGIFDQNAALLADLAGLSSTQISDAFAPGVFDATAFTTAISDLFDVSAFNNLGADVTPIVTDLSAIFTSLF